MSGAPYMQALENDIDVMLWSAFYWQQYNEIYS